MPKKEVKEEKQKVDPKPVLKEEKQQQVLQPPEVKKEPILTFIEAQEKQWKTEENYGWSLDAQSVVNGIIWSEILGPPKAKKKYKI
ncbi:MAG: hypothetical protein GXW85_12680 [Clostridia bacterium]|nr:hypothetical protein [Clostridia bacterium]